MAVREDGTPWWPENSKEAYANACKNLAAALKNWDESGKGKRQGRRVGFPSFKSKRSTRKFAFTTGTIEVGADRHHVTLPSQLPGCLLELFRGADTHDLIAFWRGRDNQVFGGSRSGFSERPRTMIPQYRTRLQR
ncbi:hypothetical protein [Nocardia carnea]|uniref:hypothetical protein n=1 Tax=Nocardia carnea TaxID=37328 RepID=UPI00245430D1|nr:hypothetical protein [Nocardia carnea]